MVNQKKKEAKVYKALMVEKETHYRVIVEATKNQLTVTQFINNLLDNQCPRKKHE